MPTFNRSFLGVGKVSARPYGSIIGFRDVGNVSVVDVAQQLDVKKQRDYQRVGGGTASQVERLESINAAMTWLSFSPENMALACAGSLADHVAATVSTEVVKGYKGKTVRLAHPPATITTVTNVGATITYVAGTHYERTAAGLYFPDLSTIVEAADLEVTYTHLDYSRIEAAMQTSTDLEVMVEGLNEADSAKPVILDIWRLHVSAAEKLAMIGDDFASQVYNAELLKDPTKGSLVSAFYRVRAVK